MHDLLRPLEDLKEIKKSLGENTDSKTMKLIDTKIAEYESDIKAVEDYLRQESEKIDTSFLDEVNTGSVVSSFTVGPINHGELDDTVKVTYGIEDEK